MTQSNYTYDSVTGRISTAGLGTTGATTYQITPQIVRGLSNSPALFSSQNQAVIVDPRSFATYYRMDRWGRLVVRTTPDGAVENWYRSRAGDVIAHTDPSFISYAPTAYYWYSSQRNLVREDRPDQSWVTYTYDPVFQQLTGSRNVLNEWNSFTVDSQTGLRRTAENAAGRTTYSYYAVGTPQAGLLSEVLDPFGTPTQYTYDGNRRLQEVVQVNPVQPLNPLRTTTTYDGYGEIRSVKDPLWRTNWSYSDTRGRVTGTLAADGGQTSTLYDATGRVTATKNALNTWTNYQYDGTGRGWQSLVIQDSTSQSPAITEVVYDDAGNAIVRIDPLLRRTTIAYDTRNRPTLVLDALGYPSSTIFDATSNPVFNFNAYGVPQQTIYDVMQRPIISVDVYGNRTSTVYDLAGHLIQTQTPDNQFNTNFYDLVGRKTATVQANGSVQTTQYDALNSVVQQVDPTGLITSFVYDALGRNISITKGVGAAYPSITGMSYDFAGQLTATLDATQKLTTYAYDDVGRQTATTDPAGAERLTFYNWGSQVWKTVDPSGVGLTTMAYDKLGRMTEQTDGAGKTTTSVYDKVGNVLSVTDPLLHTQSSDYDALNRRIFSYDAQLRPTTYIYDKVGNLLSQKDPTGAYAQWQYDALNRNVVSIDANAKSSWTAYDPMGRATWTMDALFQVTKVGYDPANQRMVSENARNERVTTIYDLAGRTLLTQAPLEQDTLTEYDYLGRPTLVMAIDGTLTGMAYDLANRPLVTVLPNTSRVTSLLDTAGRVIGIAEAEGRLTSSIYDGFGRVMETVNAKGTRTTYLRDAVGRVISTTEGAGTLAARTFGMVYDDAGQPVVQVDAFGYATTSKLDVHGRATEVLDQANQPANLLYDAVGRVTEQVDVNGRRTVYHYDWMGNKTLEIMAAGSDDEMRTTMTYNGVGNLLETIVRTGPTTTVITTQIYDTINRPMATVNAYGQRTTVIRDAAGNITQQINAKEKITGFTYDAGNRLFETLQPGGGTTMIISDVMGQEVASVDATNRTTFTVRDDLGRPIAQVDNLNKWATSKFDPEGNKTQTVDRAGVIVQTQHDLFNRATKTLDSEQKFTLTQFDLGDQVIATTDQNTFVQTMSRDKLGRVTSTLNSLNQTTKSAYDKVGNRTASIDGLGVTMLYAYDAQHRQTLSTNALSQTTAQQFDLAGRVTASLNQMGEIVGTVYDDLNRPIVTIDGVGRRTTTAYDAVGQVIGVTDPSGTTTVYGYDDFGRQISMQNTLGQWSYSEYDYASRVTKTLDTLGRPTLYGYDGAGRQITVTNPKNETTTTVYDDAGRRIALVDASNNRTTWVYDGVGRVTAEINPLGKTATMRYDAAGLLTSTTDRTGKKTDYGYDSLNRKISESWYTNTNTLIQTQSWSYDAAGRMKTATDPDGIYTFTYDTVGRLTHVAQPFGQWMTMSYDAAGRRTNVLDSQGGNTTSQFDASGQLLKRSWVGTAGTDTTAAGAVTYSYDGRGLKTGVSRFSNAAATTKIGETQNTYDNKGRLTVRNHKKGDGSTITNESYNYDNGDRLTSKTIDGATTSYQYDAIDQLVSENSSTYSYDSTGNRTNSGYITNTGNRLTADGMWAYTYDDNGAVVSKSRTLNEVLETWEYGYDHRGMMVTAKQTVGSTVTRSTYSYDSFGNTLATGIGGTTVWSVYDGWDTAKPSGAVGTEDFDLLATLREGDGMLIDRRYYGSGWDEFLGKEWGTGGGPEAHKLRWSLTDHQGSLRRVLDAAGNAIGWKEYNAFGLITSQTGELEAVAYTGRVWNGFTLLQHSRARMYDPTTARWYTVDPMGFDAGDANLYRYVGNGVTTRSDPSGMYLLASTEEAAKKISETVRATCGIDEKSMIDIVRIGYDKNARYMIAPSPRLKLKVLQALQADMKETGGKGGWTYEVLSAIYSSDHHVETTDGVGIRFTTDTTGRVDKSKYFWEDKGTRAFSGKEMNYVEEYLKNSGFLGDYRYAVADFRNAASKHQVLPTKTNVDVSSPVELNLLEYKSYKEANPTGFWMGEAGISFMKGAQDSVTAPVHLMVLATNEKQQQQLAESARKFSSLSGYEQHRLLGTALQGYARKLADGDPNAIGELGGSIVGPMAIGKLSSMSRLAPLSKIDDFWIGLSKSQSKPKILPGQPFADVIANELDSPLDLAANIKPKPGYFDVAAHGNPDGIIVRLPKSERFPDGLKVAISPEEAAGIIRKMPGYTEGTPLRLIVCDTAVPGTGGISPYGARLSQEMKVPVLAPTRKVWPYPDGTLEVMGGKYIDGVLRPMEHVKGQWMPFGDEFWGNVVSPK